MNKIRYSATPKIVKKYNSTIIKATKNKIDYRPISIVRKIN